jgi:hypothetical protein
VIVQERFKILQGEGKQSSLDKLVEIGGFTIGLTKKSIGLSVGIVAEIGDMLMYVSGQRRYARELRAREPGDRAARGLETALDAFDKAEKGKGYKPEELSTYASLDFASANKELKEVDTEAAIENTPAVVKLIEKIPDTPEGARVAEQVVADGLAAIVDDFNAHVRPIPAQGKPSD